VRLRPALAYAASRWMDVLSGSISLANPRSQLTKTWPRSSIWSTTPRSPAHRPESSLGVVTSSILIPMATPARILAARNLAPFASMAAISVSRPTSFTLAPPSAGGERNLPTKTRRAGELLRNRRLRIGSPAYAVPEDTA
jgi:hypothetical protein